MASQPPSPQYRDDALLITVRFTTNVPDLTLTIPYPSKTKCLFLKHRIRNSLPASSPIKTNRLRLIYRGKILQDEQDLNTVLKLPPPPPRQQPIANNGKGKENATDPEPTRVYINCSIGDVLTAEELGTEASTALATLTSRSKPSPPTTTEGRQKTGLVNDGVGSSTSARGGETQENEQSTTPAPLGFDRLLATGFTLPEVHQLRLQFLAIQSHIHTPETMPSPSTLRRMEDAWIDNNSTGPGTGNGAGGTGGGFEDIDGLPGALDDLLWGNVIGFLWPLGAVLAVREEGVWSRRRGVAVVGGMIISVLFGMMRVLS